MNGGCYAYKTPRRKYGVALPAVPHKKALTAEGDKKHPNCYGCWGGAEPHPSQRYHMAEGGCLHDAMTVALHQSIMDSVALELGKSPEK